MQGQTVSQHHLIFHAGNIKLILNVPFANICILQQHIYILNGCQESLVQGRFTWRHDSVLNVLASSIWKLTPPSSKLFADIPLWRASDSLCPHFLPISVLLHLDQI